MKHTSIQIQALLFVLLKLAVDAITRGGLHLGPPGSDHNGLDYLARRRSFARRLLPGRAAILVRRDVWPAERLAGRPDGAITAVALLCLIAGDLLLVALCGVARGAAQVEARVVGPAELMARFAEGAVAAAARRVLVAGRRSVGVRGR